MTISFGDVSATCERTVLAAIQRCRGWGVLLLVVLLVGQLYQSRARNDVRG
jgi:hypothetical protein